MLSLKFGSDSHSKIYSKYRPSPPEKAWEIVFDFLREKIPMNEWDTAIDVGCGTGQGTVHLAQHFKKVYGIDSIHSQIEVAKQMQHSLNITYEVGIAEELSNINDGSAQLITEISAADWFHLEKFMVNVKRILSVNGVIALIGDSFKLQIINPKNPDDNRLTDLFEESIFKSVITKYFEMKNNRTDKQYKDYVQFFPNNFTIMYDDNIKMSFKDNAQYLIGMIKATFIFNAFLKDEPQKAKDFIDKIEQNIREILNSDDLLSFQLQYTRNFLILIGRKK